MLQQLLSTAEDCLMKGSAVSKSSNVRGRGLSISVYYIILAVTNKGDNCRSAPAESTSIDMYAPFDAQPKLLRTQTQSLTISVRPACHLSLLSFSKHEPTRQTLLYNPDPLLQKYYNSLKKFSTKSSCIGNQLYNRLSCQLGPDTQGHFLRMGGGGWLSAKDFWAVQRVLLAECSQSKHGAPHFPGPKKDGDQLQLSHFISIGQHASEQGTLPKPSPTALNGNLNIHEIPGGM
ncbi:hypothetical protein DPMN_079020 [Dreissena polymorpha]|uniref:Uncharacterized protein n=1 Tax=Dreissena polymorpha TaxID=45954 RepID=A0A9D4BQR4_DREPO|nr:hypothetical protein DPMN_079020 [Dreissena polymorpha]